jgi:diadenosine tetraphosphate (Ap4A) HIT family hydrolase
MEKYRSLDQQYRDWIIKEYQHWTLLVHDDQRYLGRAYVWLVREGGMQRLSEITDAESDELRIVMREYENALQALWKPDFMNYAWLANLFEHHGGHGHMHLIPRYKDTRTFADIEFVDGKWGQNYSPYEEFKPSQEILTQVRDVLKEAMV